METIKVGSWTNHGKVLFIDRISETVSNPLCKTSLTNLCSHRISDLVLIDKPEEEIEKEIKIKSLIKEKFKLLKQIVFIEKEIEELK